MDEVIKTLITFLGGGIIGAGIQWARAARSEREKRHSEYIKEQLQRLYGPLYFLTSINSNLFELNNNILSAHKDYFDGNKWSNDPETRKSLSTESEATINLANEYIYEVVKNNKNIMKLLRDNYSFIDVDDTNIFQEFIVDALRMNKEVEEEKIKKMPFEIYITLGGISYSRPDFLERIKVKFLAKQDVLKQYH